MEIGSRGLPLVPGYGIVKNVGVKVIDLETDPLGFFRTKRQEDKKIITLGEVLEQIGDQPVCGASILVDLLKQPNHIPPNFREMRFNIYFLGTVYRSPRQEPCVRYLGRYGEHFEDRFSTLDEFMGEDDYFACREKDLETITLAIQFSSVRLSA